MKQLRYCFTVSTPIACFTLYLFLIESLRPPKEFIGRGKIEGKWNPSYAFTHTRAYRELAGRITKELDGRLRNVPGYIYSEVYKLWNGSVGLDYKVYVNALSTVTDEVLMESLNKMNDNSTLNFTWLGIEKAETTAPTSTVVPKTSSPPGEIPELWLIVLIVAGAVILFLLVTVVLLLVRIKNKNQILYYDNSKSVISL